MSSRELQRIWVRNEELAWALPKALDGLWNRIFYSVQLHRQDFAPIESRIKLRGLEKNDHLQGNEWVGEHRAPGPFAVLTGESGSVKLKGQEWSQSPGDPQWPSRDETESPAGNLIGDEWNRATKGEEWSEGLQGQEWTSLRGREWTTASTSLVGSEWAGPKRSDSES